MFGTEKKGYSKEEVDKYIEKIRADYEQQLAAQKERIFELKQSIVTCEAKINDYKSRDSLITKAIFNAVAKAEEIERVAREKYEMEIAQLKAFHAKWQSYYEEIIKQYPLDEALRDVTSFNRNMTKVLGKNELEIDELNEMEFPPLDRMDAERTYEEERSRLSKSQGVNLDAISRVMDTNEPDQRFENMIKKISGKAKPFNPMEKINNYLSSEPKQEQKTTKKKSEIAATAIKNIPIQESGFDYEEAQNPTQSLDDILKDLGF